MPEITGFHDDMRSWRRHLHRHPELPCAGEPARPSIIDKLESFGVYSRLTKSAWVEAVASMRYDPVDRIRRGSGPADNGRVLHSPHYDFNDEVLPTGASCWAELVEKALPRRS